ncbi:hypothetical protein Sjap_012043 [Stephania japonica]|uniref:Uncharacterized protein n=1 Tax=Stephania japonica TaxID=461633 RepID=A0AAP0JCF3_9MAGN
MGGRRRRRWLEKEQSREGDNGRAEHGRRALAGAEAMSMAERSGAKAMMAERTGAERSGGDDGGVEQRRRRTEGTAAKQRTTAEQRGRRQSRGNDGGVEGTTVEKRGWEDGGAEYGLFEK